MIEFLKSLSKSNDEMVAALRQLAKKNCEKKSF